jgi:hypothetical protein
MQHVITTPWADVPEALFKAGWAAVTPTQWQTVLGVPSEQMVSLLETWNHLPADTHLRDGGHYRFRRHSCFTLDTATAALTQVPHRAHWQSVQYNALHGGIERWFEPMQTQVLGAPAWQILISQLGVLLARVKPAPTWFIEAHQFRVDTTGGIGRPTPEGAHRDGVDFVAVFMVQRHGIKGGETRVFDAHGPNGVRFTLSEPWSLLLLDDERVIHESTPIQPVEAHGWRDTLVVTFRAAGFQA